MQGNEGKPAAGSSSGSKRSKKDGKGRKKGRGPRRPNPNLHRRELKVSLDDVPEGAERKGFRAHTVRDIVFFAQEVAWLREVWQCRTPEPIAISKSIKKSLGSFPVSCPYYSGYW